MPRDGAWAMALNCAGSRDPSGFLIVLRCEIEQTTSSGWVGLLGDVPNAQQAPDRTPAP